MSSAVLTKTYPAPPVDEREALRYAACREADPATLALLRECVAEAADKVVPRVCWCRLPVTVTGTACCIGPLQWRSAALAAQLAGCTEAVVFAATVGVEIDRLITKYSRLSPARAVLLQAFGAERIEALCDAFCAEQGGTLRFSPGYGDLPLAAQRDIFRLLQPERRIGVCLNDSLLMSPTKSVTAVVGIRECFHREENRPV